MFACKTLNITRFYINPIQNTNPILMRLSCVLVKISNHENQMFCLNQFIKMYSIKHVLLIKIFFRFIPGKLRREFIKNVVEELEEKTFHSIP